MSTTVSVHKKIERNVTWLAVLAFIAVAIGGFVEIALQFSFDFAAQPRAHEVDRKPD